MKNGKVPLIGSIISAGSPFFVDLFPVAECLPRYSAVKKYESNSLTSRLGFFLDLFFIAWNCEESTYKQCPSTNLI